jgi:trk system potassium uptake protein
MNIVIIGCGRVGSRLATVLLHRGDRIAVVDPDHAALQRLGDHLPVIRIHGDAGDAAVLEQAGVRSADGLAAVTGSDERNAVIARLAATVFHVPRVVARIYDPAKAELYRRLGVQTIAPIAWGVDRLAELLAYSELVPVASLGTGQVEMVDVRVPALLDGRPSDELNLPGETTVVALTRDGSTMLAPGPTTLLRSGDVAHLAAASTTRLEGLLEHGLGRGPR